MKLESGIYFKENVLMCYIYLSNILFQLNTLNIFIIPYIENFENQRN